MPLNVERKELNEFNGFKDGKLPEPPPPGPPGSIPVVFGPDDMFRSDSELNLLDAVNADKKRHKLYSVRMEAGQKYQIDMITNQFDAFLYLVDDKNDIVARDDDSGGEQNARITFRAPRTAVYHIVATYFINDPGMNNPAGNFTLLVRHLK